MIRIGKLTDYALLILSQLARSGPEAILSAAVLADVIGLPVPTVSKILKMLSDQKLVKSVRGPVGGYLLAMPAASISVMDVINAMEGEVALTECCEMTSLCAIDHACTMKENWRKINKMVQTLLCKFTIIDMMNPLFGTEQPTNGK